MDVTETQADGLKRELKVVVTAAEIDDKVTERLKDIGSDVRMPGFRPGKVPLQILRKRFGRSVLGEVLERTVSESTETAVNDRGFRPASTPKVEITAFDEGKDLEYTVSLELMPEITPVDFSTLVLERLKPDVGDAEVDDAVARVAENQKRTEPLEEPRPAENGDTVVIDFVGSVDGETFEGGSATDFNLELGTGRFIPGFEDQLVGASAGDTRTVAVTFPADYPSAALAGKEATFETTVKEVRRTVPVTVDEAFAQSLGLESLEKLREAIRGQVERDYEQLARMRLKRRLLDRLAETHDFSIPQGMVEQEFDTIWKQVTEAGEVAVTEGSDEEAKEKAEYRAIAERRVKLGLLLAEVGRLNNITVGEDEIRQAVAREASRHPGHERQFVEAVTRSPEALNQVRAPIFEDKVVDFILEMAQVSERSVPVAELAKAEEEESAPAGADEAKG